MRQRTLRMIVCKSKSEQISPLRSCASTYVLKQQLCLFKENLDLIHGGVNAKGKRKALRPLSTKHPIHLVLKASEPFQLLRNTETVEQTLKKYALKFGITLYEIAVQADHLHLNIKIPSRELYCAWIRAITSVLAFKLGKLKWSLPPFTRIATWGREFKRLKDYIQRNKTYGSFLLEAHQRVDQFREKLIADLATLWNLQTNRPGDA